METPMVRPGLVKNTQAMIARGGVLLQFRAGQRGHPAAHGPGRPQRSARRHPAREARTARGWSSRSPAPTTRRSPRSSASAATRGPRSIASAAADRPDLVAPAGRHISTDGGVAVSPHPPPSPPVMPRTSSRLAASRASRPARRARTRPGRSLRGVAYLREGRRAGGVGEAAMAALALVKAEVPRDDPALERPGQVLKRRSPRFGVVYTPSGRQRPEIYEAGRRHPGAGQPRPASPTSPDRRRGSLHPVAGRTPTGRGTMTAGRRHVDLAVRRARALGGRERRGRGPPAIWDRAAQSVPRRPSGRPGAGPTTATRRQPGDRLDDRRRGRQPPDLRAPARPVPARPSRSANPLLIPLDRRERAEAVHARGRAAADRPGGPSAGIDWLGATSPPPNPPVIGHSPYYALYGIERIGALADQATLGRRDWFAEGRRYLASTQSGRRQLHGAVRRRARTPPGPSCS